MYIYTHSHSRVGARLGLRVGYIPTFLSSLHSIYLPACLPTYLPIDFPTYPSIYLCICLATYLYAHAFFLTHANQYL